MRIAATALLSAALLGACAGSPQPAPSLAATASASRLFLFVYRPGPAWMEGKPMAEQNLGGHVTYMSKLFKEGALFAGGALTDNNSGLAIVRAAEEEEARAILAADPAMSLGVFAADVREWQPRFHSDQPLVRAD